MISCTLVHQRPGGRPVELTTVESGLQFDTAAVGGFGSLSATLPGDRRKQLGYLGRVQALYGATLLWEGQLEDQTISYDEQAQTTTFRAFGLQRKLSETSVRRVWSKRDIDWLDYPPGNPGSLIWSGNDRADLSEYTGTAIVAGDPTRIGASFGGNGTLIDTNGARAVIYFVPAGLTLTNLLCTFTLIGPNTGVGKMLGIVAVSTNNRTSWSFPSEPSATANLNVSLGSPPTHISLGFWNNSGGALTPTTGDVAIYESIRLVGTSLTEDAAGGFYGGTILRDLVGLVAGLNIGVIEDGSDFTIQAIERAVRTAAQSVVDEVAGYYTREWAVWEDGRFDWKTRNLDEAQWVVHLEDTTTLEIDATIDDLARTVYVLYTDAASEADSEASAAGIDQRNPYVRQGITKDALVSPGFPMTANTSAALAARIAGDTAARPSASGRVTLPANRPIANAVGAAKPAALIRGGDNILLPELPKTDYMLQGRDGETLFHVAASTVDLDANTVTLELEGQQSRADVLLARLAAVTRTLTG